MEKYQKILNSTMTLTKNTTSRNQGFTLVELSIVLVVIAVIVGAVLLATDMINKSKVYSLGKEFQEYNTAFYVFRNKYNGLPGDLPNASSFWSTAASGNGNRSIKLWPPPAEGNEAWQAWLHLQLAGMVGGYFSGINGPGTTWGDAIIGTNVPESKVIPGTGFTVDGSLLTHAGDTNYFSGKYGLVLAWGKNKVNAAGNRIASGTYRGALDPSSTYGFDIKYDDGRPGTGNVMTYISTSGNAPGCCTTNVPGTSEYNVTNNAGLCNIIWKMGF